PRARSGDDARREPREPRVPRGEATSHGDARRAEREAAYAKNPDQPIVKRPDAGAGTDHHAHIHAARKARPVPALLQKRQIPEPEKV
ncbi:MAG: hypothetical protein WCB48_02905, partial [Casimicrobiaceae bacterium]